MPIPPWSGRFIDQCTLDSIFWVSREVVCKRDPVSLAFSCTLFHNLSITMLHSQRWCYWLGLSVSAKSLRPSDPYMRHKTKPLLVTIIKKWIWKYRLLTDGHFVSTCNVNLRRCHHNVSFLSELSLTFDIYQAATLLTPFYDSSLCIKANVRIIMKACMLLCSIGNLTLGLFRIISDG